MTSLREERRMTVYTCGRCKGEILYQASKGKPKVCPECGYGHGTRDVNDIPSEVRVNLKRLNLSAEGSRGALEKTTITSR
jgi:ribosomal protein L37E